jgi:hypothetical protein
MEEWQDGTVYLGEYSHGRKNGIGTYKWADGSRYEGKFYNNKCNGYVK